jgi:CBS domain-containing protein
VSWPAFTRPPATPVYEALARMRDRGEQLAVITSDGRAVGVLSVSDILRRVLPSAHRIRARS